MGQKQHMHLHLVMFFLDRMSAFRFDNLPEIQTNRLKYTEPEEVTCDIPGIVRLIQEYRPQTITELEDSIPLLDYKKHLQYATEKTTKFIELLVKREAMARCLHERQNRLNTLRRFCAGKHSKKTCDILNSHLKNCDINPDNFKETVQNLLMETNHKRNTLYIHGCIDSGKSLIAQALVEPFVSYRGTMSGSTGEHYFDDMLQKSIMLIEEGWVLQALADDYKSILSGYPLSLNLKHIQRRSKLRRTPVIITSNYPTLGRNYLRNIDEMALQARCVKFNFKKKFKTERVLTQKQIVAWILCNNCRNKDG